MITASLPSQCSKPGRGYTCDDPDMLGTVMIVVPAFLYLAYNVQVSEGRRRERSICMLRL
jgi:hypothetical protein